jgi:hypothetical protein
MNTRQETSAFHLNVAGASRTAPKSRDAAAFGRLYQKGNKTGTGERAMMHVEKADNRGASRLF